MAPSKQYKLALVGTDSLRGREIKRVLQDGRFPFAGIEFFDPGVREAYSKLTQFGDEPKVIRGLDDASLEGMDLVFLAADKKTNRKYGQRAAKLRYKAIDLAETFNQDPSVPLIVAGVNDALLAGAQPPLIANPHPVTIMLSHWLKPLVGRFGMARAAAFILQPASAFDESGIDELAAQSMSLLSGAAVPKKVFKQQVAFNVLSHTETPGRDGFSTEERLIQAEVRRVLGRPDLPLSLSVVQASLFHTYAVMTYLELEQEAGIADLDQVFAESAFLKRSASAEPCDVSCLSVTGRDEVFIGAVKKDETLPRVFWVWAIADNLTRGSALNALEVAQALFGLSGGA